MPTSSDSLSLVKPTKLKKWQNSFILSSARLCCHPIRPSFSTRLPFDRPRRCLNDWSRGEVISYQCTADLLFDLFRISCFAFISLTTDLIVWSNQNWSNRRSAVLWYFPTWIKWAFSDWSLDQFKAHWIRHHVHDTHMGNSQVIWSMKLTACGLLL